MSSLDSDSFIPSNVMREFEVKRDPDNRPSSPSLGKIILQCAHVEIPSPSTKPLACFRSSCMFVLQLSKKEEGVRE